MTNRGMSEQERRLELGRYLREARERTTPHKVGLPMTPRRRTPGLRREEVASLAGISVTYYTKIEQGRVDVSSRVLNDLSEVFQLSHTERKYAFALSSGLAVVQPEEQVSEALHLFLDLQEPYPAQVMGRRWDLLAWNQATCATLGDMDALPPQARNLVLMMFTVPELREVISDWERNARCMLAEFRADYGRYHNDPAFSELIDYLKQHSPEFKQWWSEAYNVGCGSEIEKVINHPMAGRLNLYEMAMKAVDHPGMRVLMFLPRDSATERKLQELYEWRMAMKEEATEEEAIEGEFVTAD
jgi:transcriptional regulator with XRE-family HTH domain